MSVKNLTEIRHLVRDLAFRVLRARRQQDIRALEVTVDDWLVKKRQFFSQKLPEFATIRHNSPHFQSKLSDLVAILVLILRECVQVVHPTRHIQRRLEDFRAAGAPALHIELPCVPNTRS